MHAFCLGMVASIDGICLQDTYFLHIYDEKQKINNPEGKEFIHQTYIMWVPSDNNMVTRHTVSNFLDEIEQGSDQDSFLFWKKQDLMR